MQKTDAKALLEKYRLGTCTDAEKDIVETWYLKSDIKNPDVLSEDAIDESLSRVWAKLDTQSSTKKVRLWPRLAVAAAAAAIIFGAGLFYFVSDINKDPQTAVYVNDVGPGKMGATLTLASGKRILLTEALNGELAHEAGVVISKTAKGQLVYEVTASDEAGKINTLSTAKGETYMVVLPDKSKVWLNAASSLKYPTSFAASKERSVSLTGEAYFEVNSDKTRPFLVKTGKQEVEVLGTHFNISSYEDEHATRTTLSEGSVKIKFNNIARIIKPGEQSVLTNNNLSVAHVEPAEVIAWKDGLFVFEEEDLESAMRKVARWYDLKVIYEDQQIKNLPVGGSITRYGNVSKVLRLFEMSKEVRFTIENRTIKVKSIYKPTTNQ